MRKTTKNGEGVFKARIVAGEDLAKGNLNWQSVSKSRIVARKGLVKGNLNWERVPEFQKKKTWRMGFLSPNCSSGIPGKEKLN